MSFCSVFHNIIFIDNGYIVPFVTAVFIVAENSDPAVVLVNFAYIVPFTVYTNLAVVSHINSNTAELADLAAAKIVDNATDRLADLVVVEFVDEVTESLAD